jgi:hypothetical protein
MKSIYKYFFHFIRIRLLFTLFLFACSPFFLDFFAQYKHEDDTDFKDSCR